VPEGPRARGWRLKVLAAFAAIYFIWGSTFLAVHVALVQLPPFFLCAVRLLAAGALLVGWARVRGDDWPRGEEWRNASLVGVLLPAVGNTAVTVGIAHIPSGLVALLVATIPLFVALLSAFGPRAGRPGALAVAGLVLGFAGIGLLVGPGLSDARHPDASPLWAMIPVAGSLSWAWGSLWSRGARMPRSPLMATGVGGVAGGAPVAVLSALAGDLARVQPAHVGLPALLALAYLVVFGSVVAFTGYLFLLREVSPATVSTYAFVNPVVAIGLGWAFAGEALSPRTLAAAALVIASVVLITWTQAHRAIRTGVEAARGEAA
jgi:drug/metabolite transporter (DMT)-like permease